MDYLLAASLVEMLVDEKVTLMDCLLAVSSDEKNVLAVRLAEMTMWEVVTERLTSSAEKTDGVMAQSLAY